MHHGGGWRGGSWSGGGGVGGNSGGGGASRTTGPRLSSLVGSKGRFSGNLAGKSDSSGNRSNGCRNSSDHNDRCDNHNDNHKDKRSKRSNRSNNNAPWYPPQFPDNGFSENYNSDYYQKRGFAMNTSPYGLKATFVPSPSRKCDTWNGSSWASGGAYYNGQYYNKNSNYFPYFQGKATGDHANYRPYGVYGSNGPYLVPSGGVGTAAVQSQLLQRGFYQGPVDGFNGELTRAAIRTYQTIYSLPVSGRIDGYLIRSLRENQP